MSAASAPRSGPAVGAEPHRERRWAALTAVAVSIALQLALPERLSLGPGWLLPTTEAVIAASLLLVNPFNLSWEAAFVRRVGLLLVAVMSAANAVSAVLLIRGLIHGRVQGGAVDLLADGAGIYATNVIAFALWYWELDGGGPRARYRALSAHPDFLFPQMTAPDTAPPGWRPLFADYLYLSFTNTTAFSPTDTMPLSRWAKLLMMGQSAIALVTISLVIARAVNIFQ